MADEDRSLAEWAAQDAGDAVPAVASPSADPLGPQDAPAEAISEQVTAEAPEPIPEAVRPDPEGIEEPKPKKPQPLPKWMKDRLAEQTAKQHDADRRAAEERARADAAEAALEAMHRKSAPPNGDPPPVTDSAPPAAARKTPEGFVAATEIEARARQLAADQAFNERANASYNDGKKSYPDFDDALGTLSAMNAVQRRDFQEAALATGAAHDVIYHLGSNPDEAQQILSYLTSGATARATAEMTKIALKVGATRSATRPKNNVSSAPAPIRPVGGSAVPSFDLEKASDEEFTDELNKRARANGWW